MAEEIITVKDYEEEYNSSKSLSSCMMDISRSGSLSQLKNKEDDETYVMGETIIAFTREVNRRLEMEKKHEHDMLKLKYEHEMEMKTKNSCSLM